MKDEGSAVIFALVMLFFGVLQLLLPSDMKDNPRFQELSEMHIQTLGAGAIGFAMFILAPVVWKN